MIRNRGLTSFWEVSQQEILAALEETVRIHYETNKGTSIDLGINPMLIYSYERQQPGSYYPPQTQTIMAYMFSAILYPRMQT